MNDGVEKAREALRVRDEILANAPALVGSEKQVKWATDLRANAILFALMQEGDEEIADLWSGERITLTREHIIEMASITDARKWIEARSVNDQTPHQKLYMLRNL